MNKLFKDKPSKKPGGGLNDRPICERCGRPVKISSDDYGREEILCATCATELRTPAIEDYESSRAWSE